MADESSQPPPRTQTPCPVCNVEAERGQLICLECGSRIALRHRKPPSWKVPVGILAVVTVLAGAGAVLAYEAIDDEARREAEAAPPRVKGAAEKSGDPGAEPKPAAEQPGSETPEPSLGPEDPGSRDDAGADPADDAAEEQPAAADGELIPDGQLFIWPLTLEGFTVVVQSTEDRGSATAFARSVAQSDDGQVGVISAADFRTVPRGFFVVFVGSYEDRVGAQRAAARLGGRFQGAFPQVVRR